MEDATIGGNNAILIPPCISENYFVGYVFLGKFHKSSIIEATKEFPPSSL